MSKFKVHASKREASVAKHSGEEVINFMGGTSYTLSPLNTLKIIAASSIFGEPAYYRSGVGGLGETTADIFTQAVNDALDFDFKATLDFAVELRHLYYMRMNPAVIFILASMHKNRKKFNEENPLYMREIGKNIADIPTDLTNQFEYFMYLNKSKNKLPGVVKRTWAERLGEFNRYSISKYQTQGRIRDLVRISHANSDIINELMKTDGILKLEENNTTWERLRSDGKTWEEILQSIKMPHMALLRNLRGIFLEVSNESILKNVCNMLKEGVPYGKQFPFRYFSATKALINEGVKNPIILDTLEECLDIAMNNFPKLSGKTMCLSDNSGSAWGVFNSEYGTNTVAEIGNLSSFMTSINSDEGYVGFFGDRLEIMPASKRNGVLSQLRSANKTYGKNSRNYVGGGTENGIWIFFKNALNTKEYWDNIFIYSDMQAGHGGLYGTSEGITEYQRLNFNYKGGNHVDVFRLIEEYRAKVNPKVNVFSVQIAGYNNAVIPENIYRGSILAGWTGKEVLFAKKIIDTWNEQENMSQK